MSSGLYVREVQGGGKKPLEREQGCNQELSFNVKNKTHPLNQMLFWVKFGRLERKEMSMAGCLMKGLVAILRNLDFIL